MSVFNGERFLREAVESILNQTLRDFEFIIIDDGSTDDTASILDSYVRTDPRVQVFHQENRGMVESLNRGCGLARGKYIARMDADDIAFPDRLERQLAYLERHPEIAVLGAAFEVIEASGRRLSTIVRPATDQELRKVLKTQTCFQHSTVVMRREAFFAVKGYRKAFRRNDDYDLFLRMLERYQGANLPEPLLYYRVHPCQASCSSVRQLVLEGLVARAAANIRSREGPDPLWQVDEITPHVAKALGITDADIQKAVVDAYAGRISIMWRASQAPAALQYFNELLELEPSQRIPRSAAADGRLAETCIHYRKGRLFRALLAAGRALWARPTIAGRPLKRALNSFFPKR
jgi:hypothetical protein